MPDRAYQVAAAHHTIPDLWRAGKKRVCLVLPTGGGKTRVAEMLIARIRAADWAPCFFVAHTSELLTQPGARFAGLGIAHAYIKAGMAPDPTAGVQVCGVQTLVNRDVAPVLKDDGVTPHRRCVIFVDESHRVKASTYLTLLQRFHATYEHVYLVLMTATPYRLDGRGLADICDALIEATTPTELIAAGILIDPVYYSRPPKDATGLNAYRLDTDEGTIAQMLDSKLVGDVVATWQERARGLPTICQCVNRAHARDVAARFNAAGVRSAMIEAATPPDARGLLYARLAIDRRHPDALDVLCTGGTLLAEGYDSAASYRHVLARPALSWRGPGDADDPTRSAPPQPPAYVPLACLIDAAPTTSRGAWIQRLGRVARAFTAADVAEWDARGLRAQVKDRAVVLCHSGNLERHGFLVQHHGFSLTGDREGAPKVRELAYPAFRAPAVVQCPHCFASVQRGSLSCPACGQPSPQVSAPLPKEDASVPLVRAKFDPSTLPPATDEQKTAYLRKLWQTWAQKRAERAAAGLPPYSVHQPSVLFRARFGAYPDWSQNAHFARLRGAKLR